mmetsp:Transcript_34221/g.75281  ORF Transcript_34221/g.75281 Transcript_34221/m.75281 type:complete len:1641 (+) Transcript_34221:235-5157(+)
MESVEEIRRRLKNEARAKRDAERERRRAAAASAASSGGGSSAAPAGLAAGGGRTANANASASSSAAAPSSVQARIDQLKRERKERELRENGRRLLRENFAGLFDDDDDVSKRPGAAASAPAPAPARAASGSTGRPTAATDESKANGGGSRTKKPAAAARAGGWTSKSVFTGAGAGRDRGHGKKKSSSNQESKASRSAGRGLSSKDVPREVNLSFSGDCSLDEKPSHLHEPSPLNDSCTPPSPPKKRKIEPSLSRRVAESASVLSAQKKPSAAAAAASRASAASRPVKPFAPSYSLGRSTNAAAPSAAKPPKKKPSLFPSAWRQNSDSEDSDDIVEIARQAQAEKEREELERRAMAEKKKAADHEDYAASADTSRGRRKRADSSSDEGEGGHSSRRKEAAASSRSSSSSEKRKRRRRLFDYSDSSSDEEEDEGFARPETVKQEQKERKRAHNPIAVAKMQEERILASFTTRKARRSKSPDERQNHKPGQGRFKQSHSGDGTSEDDESVAARAVKKQATSEPEAAGGGIKHDDDFWSDASIQDAGSVGSSGRPEGKKKKNSRKGKKTASGARAKPSTSSSSTTRKPAANKRDKKVPDRDAMLFDGCDENASFDSDNENDEKELESRLKPEFATPKFPVGDLEPFVLTVTKTGVAPVLFGRGGAGARCEIEPDLAVTTHSVPASLNRYLQEYQREGIKFVHETITKNRGCILGDDMGLGKTVQIIALLAAIQKKSGNEMDLRLLHQRRSRIGLELKTKREEAEQALLLGAAVPSSSDSHLEAEACKTGRILIVVPASVIDNWQNEFDTWGHFGVAVYQDKGRDAALERVRVGIDEILLCGKTLFAKKENFAKINSIAWRLVVVDEFHEYKGHRTGGHKCLVALRDRSACPIIGLTGTLIQNNYEELHTLVDLVQRGLLGERKTFMDETGKPLMHMRQKTATGATLEHGKKRQDQLHKAMKFVYIHRKKNDVLKNDLTEKTQKVIFCRLTDIQKRIYRHLLSLPDYHLLRIMNTPCDCGVNQKFFLDFKRLRSKKEQLEYQRRKKKEVVKKKLHCYQIPKNPDENSDDPIDPRAVLWRNQHFGAEPCDFCPSCILLPALSKLYKVSSHASLLQAEKDPDLLVEGTGEWESAKKVVDFAKVALPPDILADLPGASYVREDGIMDNHLELSGKMEALDYCLQKFSRRRDRVLIFSYSTKTLDLIQNYVQSNGYTYVRLDGTTATKKRQGLIDKFQKDDGIFLFLISTKAGGLGLNLTAANKVIVFDVNWNPSYDEQAQDRAFRIGQKRDVEVIRLVAQGTVEELMYARQVYKTHLKQQALGDGDDKVDAARLFRGVASDKDRKGELFGAENLLKFKDGSFMQEIWKSNGGSGSSSRGSTKNVRERDEKELESALSNLGEDGVINLGGDTEDMELRGVHEAAAAEVAKTKRYTSDGEESMDAIIHAKGYDHEDFLRKDRGGAVLNQGDEGFEEEMGGGSQMMNAICEMACEDIEDSVEDDEKKPPALRSIAEQDEGVEEKEKLVSVKHEQEEDGDGDDKQAPTSPEQGKGTAAAARADTCVHESASAAPLTNDDPACSTAPALAPTENEDMQESSAAKDDMQDSPVVEVSANILIISDAKKKATAPSAKLSGLLHRPSYARKKRKKK